MKSTSRNVMVGLFVIGGFTALGVLIVKFGESRWLFSSGYTILAKFDTVTGIREGTEVRLAGVPVGRVLGIDLAKREDPTQGVVAAIEIQRHYSIPAGSQAVVIPPLMGQPVLDIQPPPIPSDPLPRDGSAIIHARIVNPLEAVIEPKFMATLEKTTEQIGVLAEALTPAANAVTDLLEQRSIADVEQPGAPKDLTANLYTAVERLHNVLKNIETVLGDPENQNNLKVALDNIRLASEDAKVAVAGFKDFSADARQTAARANQVLDNLDGTITTTHTTIRSVGVQLAENLDKFSTLLDHLNSAGRDLAEKDGTAGMLLRDPKLYEELLLTTQRLSTAANELIVLVKQWQKQGLLGAAGK